MPFNGSGTYSRLYSWVVDAANAVNISSSRTDAEMNGFAAGLTNCVTRDGQSPPSADLPMGGKKLVNLGNPTVGTDALNMATGDTRYVLTGTVLPVASGGTGTTTSTGTGSTVLSASPSFTGIANFVGINTSGNVTLGTNNTVLQFTDTSGTHPFLACQADNVLRLIGTDASGANRTIWSIVQRSGSSTLDFSVSPTAPSQSPGDNSTKLATTAFVATALGSYAPLASPTFTGTVTAAALTATGTVTATGTLSTGTAANSLGFLGLPSIIKTANYSIVQADIGTSIDFNGTTLTCTIGALADGFICGISNINASSLTITSGTNTLTWSGTTTTGNRTLGQNGEARIHKKNGVIYISGTALS